MKECLKMVEIHEKREMEGTMKECLKMVGIQEKREMEGDHEGVSQNGGNR